MSDEVFVSVVSSGPDTPFKLVGVYDNEESAQIAYSDWKGASNDYYFGVFPMEVKESHQGSFGRMDQKDGESYDEWAERVNF